MKLIYKNFNKLIQIVKIFIKNSNFIKREWNEKIMGSE